MDAPGHKNYVPNMIAGAAQADVGVLVISARKGEFETGFEKGGQTREHALLAKTLGVRHCHPLATAFASLQSVTPATDVCVCACVQVGKLIVVINKMDEHTVKWSKKRYDTCVVRALQQLALLSHVDAPHS